MRSPAHVPEAVLSAAVPIAAIAALASFGALGSPAFQRTVELILSNIVIVIGLQAFIGLSGIYSFGHMGLAAIGAYLSALVSLPIAFKTAQLPGIPAWLSGLQLTYPWDLIAPALLVAVVALLLALPLMRTSTLAIPISTLAFLVIVFQVAANWVPVTRGTSGIIAIPVTTTIGSAGIWAGAAVVASVAFKRSSTGFQLQASRENEQAARSLGISVFWQRVAAFVLSASLVAIGAALATHQAGVLTPSTFYFGLTVATLTMLIVGGARSILGAVVGAIGVSLVNEVLRSVESGITLGPLTLTEHPGLAAIGLSLLLIVMIVLRPAGILGASEAGDLPLLRRLARHPARSVASQHDIGRRHRSLTGKLVAEDICVTFAGIRALDHVGLVLNPREILGLIGPNGAGKTTLVNVLSGFVRPESGRVLVERLELTKRTPESLARLGLARTFQAALPFKSLSVLDNVAIGAMGIGASRSRAFAQASDVLLRVGLMDRAETIAGSLPLGEQRVLGIARALATQPSYVLLDEPTAGLNEQESAVLARALDQVRHEFQCGILIVEHHLDVIMSLCQRVQVLDSGQTIMVGTPDEVRRSPAVIEAYLGRSGAGLPDA